MACGHRTSEGRTADGYPGGSLTSSRTVFTVLIGTIGLLQELKEIVWMKAFCKKVSVHVVVLHQRNWDGPNGVQTVLDLDSPLPA